MREYLGELIQGLVALGLVVADVRLVSTGHEDAGLQAAVPVIVAFYFGTRGAIGAVKQTQNGTAVAERGHRASDEVAS